MTPTCFESGGALLGADRGNTVPETVGPHAPPLLMSTRSAAEALRSPAR